MSTASVIIAAIAVISLLAMSVLITAIFSRVLQQMSRAHLLLVTEMAHQQSALLDRFQAIRWEDLAAMRAVEGDDEEGGFFAPAEELRRAVAGEDDDEEGGLTEPGGWGSTSAARERLRVLEQEQALLDEDFPEEA